MEILLLRSWRVVARKVSHCSLPKYHPRQSNNCHPRLQARSYLASLKFSTIPHVFLTSLQDLPVLVSQSTNRRWCSFAAHNFIQPQREVSSALYQRVFASIIEFSNFQVSRQELYKVPYDQRWELLKPVLERLYLDEKLKLLEIIRLIKFNYGFDSKLVSSYIFCNRHKLINIVHLVRRSISTNSTRSGHGRRTLPPRRKQPS